MIFLCCQNGIFRIQRNISSEVDFLKISHFLVGHRAQKFRQLLYKLQRTCQDNTLSNSRKNLKSFKKNAVFLNNVQSLPSIALKSGQQHPIHTQACQCSAVAPLNREES